MVSRWLRAGALLLSAGLFAWAALVTLAVPWLDRPPIDPDAAADAVVVLAGETPARVDAGIELVRAGRAPELWITGYNILPRGQISMGASDAGIAVDRGIAPEQLRLLATTSTWEDGAEVAEVVRQTGARRLLVVTSWFHGRRAVCTLRRQLAGSGVTIAYMPAPSELLPRAGWWRSSLSLYVTTREVAAVAYYSARYGLWPWECST
jgi:uncharacterized SAM-binding protein YcdF (DUF218 family)